MTAIQPVTNNLNELIKREQYRIVLSAISNSYEDMQTFINNLGQDISSIDDFVEQLDEDESQGFDIGTAKETLIFQRSTLQIDLNFYEEMKQTYMRKIYEDLYNYTDGIIKCAVEIEPNPMKKTEDEMKKSKFSGVRDFIEGENYSMSDIYQLLSTTEKNLYELSADISSFDEKILRALARQDRGFSVGNLLVNLEGQKTKLTMEFQGYIIRIEQFLEQNERFSNRCLNRVKMISSEIVTEQELLQKEIDEETETTETETTEATV